MSVVAAALILGVIVIFLVKSKLVRLSAAIVCILFGLILGVTPIGGGVVHVVKSVGSFASTQLERL